MHWNIMPQANCTNSSAPILTWKNRFRLMKEHFMNVDPDIIGLV